MNLGQFRFKTLQEYSISSGQILEPPRRYIKLNTLDDLKLLFIEKKKQAEMQTRANKGEDP